MSQGFRKRSDREEMILRCQMLNSTHLQAILQKARDELGSRYNQIGPLDFSRNPAVRLTTTLSTAHAIPAGVTGLTDALALAMGDASSGAVKRKYRKAGYAPMPSALRRASRDLERYLVFCHYCGLKPVYDVRFKRISYVVITPDVLEVETDTESGDLPVRLSYLTTRTINGKRVPAIDIYDLSDLDKPIFRILDAAGKVIEEKAGLEYPWFFSDGTPYSDIIVYGQAKDLARGLEIVEGTLRVSVGWSQFWAGFRDSCFKGRNVRGLTTLQDATENPDGSGHGQEGLAVGPESVVIWFDTNDEKPGEHWQWDSPFDAKQYAEALCLYESNFISQLAVSLDLTSTGGEPLTKALEANTAAAMAHYDAQREGDVMAIRVSAAILNEETRGSLTPSSHDDSAGHYGVDYNEELKEELHGERTDPPKPGRTSDETGSDPIEDQPE